MIFFDEIDFNNKKIYPSRKFPQWQCLYSLIKEQEGRRKMTQLAELAGCHKATLSRCLKKRLVKKQSIISIRIAKRLAKKLKRPEIVGKLCPEYMEVEKF